MTLNCMNPDCMEGHVQSCPWSGGLTPKQLANMSADEIKELREKLVESLKSPGKVTLLPSSDHDDGQFVLKFDLDRLPTPQAVDIIQRLLPEWIAQFLEANHKYREVKNELGYKGVLPDINRKYGVLKARVWDDEADVGREPTRGIILDLIGHLFLMLHMMDEHERSEMEERAATMSRHPAGKKLDLPEIPVVPQAVPVLCGTSYAFPDETLKCFRGPHGPTVNHFSRWADGTPVQWTEHGELVT